MWRKISLKSDKSEEELKPYFIRKDELICAIDYVDYAYSFKYNFYKNIIDANIKK